MRVERLRWREGDGWDFAPGGAPPSLVLYFGSAGSIESARAPAALAERYPGALVFGCSTAAGIADDRIDEGGIVGVACRFDSTPLRLAEAEVPDSGHSASAGRQLGEALRGEGLAGVLVLSDGTGVNGSALTAALTESLGGRVPVSGGLAGDGARFLRTLVGAGGSARPGRAAAVGFYGGAVRMAHASAGGWDPFGPRRRITRSSGNVLHQLDGRSALALYELYLGEEAAGLPGTALLFPLLVWNPEAPGDTLVRTVLSIDRATGSMTFAGDIPEGWSAQLMRGTFDRLVDGAARAAQVARDALAEAGGGDALGVIVSCVGRHMLLGQRTAEELHAVTAALGPGVTRVGFYSHGEIAPRRRLEPAMLQNQTMAVSLIAEAA